MGELRRIYNTDVFKIDSFVDPKDLEASIQRLIDNSYELEKENIFDREDPNGVAPREVTKAALTNQLPSKRAVNDPQAILDAVTAPQNVVGQTVIAADTPQQQGQNVQPDAQAVLDQANAQVQSSATVGPTAGPTAAPTAAPTADITEADAAEAAKAEAAADAKAEAESAANAELIRRTDEQLSTLIAEGAALRSQFDVLENIIASARANGYDTRTMEASQKRILKLLGAKNDEILESEQKIQKIELIESKARKEREDEKIRKRAILQARVDSRKASRAARQVASAVAPTPAPSAALAPEPPVTPSDPSVPVLSYEPFSKQGIGTYGPIKHPTYEEARKETKPEKYSTQTEVFEKIRDIHHKSPETLYYGLPETEDARKALDVLATIYYLQNKSANTSLAAKLGGIDQLQIDSGRRIFNLLTKYPYMVNDKKLLENVPNNPNNYKNYLSDAFIKQIENNINKKYPTEYGFYGFARPEIVKRAIPKEENDPRIINILKETISPSAQAPTPPPPARVPTRPVSAKAPTSSSASVSASSDKVLEEAEKLKGIIETIYETVSNGKQAVKSQLNMINDTQILEKTKDLIIRNNFKSGNFIRNTRPEVSKIFSEVIDEINTRLQDTIIKDKIREQEEYDKQLFKRFGDKEKEEKGQTQAAAQPTAAQPAAAQPTAAQPEEPVVPNENALSYIARNKKFHSNTEPQRIFNIVKNHIKASGYKNLPTYDENSIIKILNEPPSVETVIDMNRMKSKMRTALEKVLPKEDHHHIANMVKRDETKSKWDKDLNGSIFMSLEHLLNLNRAITQLDEKDKKIGILGTRQIQSGDGRKNRKSKKQAMPKLAITDEEYNKSTKKLIKRERSKKAFQELLEQPPIKRGATRFSTDELNQIINSILSSPL
jgi:hypothetical protein